MAGSGKIAWFEVFAGEKAFNEFKQWLPDETVRGSARFPNFDQRAADDSCRWRHSFAERRPCGRSSTCTHAFRPVRYFQGVASPVKHPERMDVVVYRENTEDVYIGIEWRSGTPEVKKNCSNS